MPLRSVVTVTAGASGIVAAGALSDPPLHAAAVAAHTNTSRNFADMRATYRAGCRNRRRCSGHHGAVMNVRRGLILVLVSGLVRRLRRHEWIVGSVDAARFHDRASGRRSVGGVDDDRPESSTGTPPTDVPVDPPAHGCRRWRSAVGVAGRRHRERRPPVPRTSSISGPTTIRRSSSGRTSSSMSMSPDSPSMMRVSGGGDPAPEEQPDGEVSPAPTGWAGFDASLENALDPTGKHRSVGGGFDRRRRGPPTGVRSARSRLG